jgi:uncharacterized phage protein (TIGR02220 family)
LSVGGPAGAGGLTAGTGKPGSQNNGIRKRNRPGCGLATNGGNRLRSRNIKPGFFKNELLAECDPLARILFIGLWCMSDREGFVEYRPKRICAEILPYENSSNFMNYLIQLGTYNFITIWCVQDRDGNKLPRFIEVTNFLTHQNPHKNEKDSEISKLFNNPEISGSLVKFHDQYSTNPADSGFLIPDSGFPLKDPCRVATPNHPADPETHPAVSSTTDKPPYEKIINFLNEVSDKKFRHGAKGTQRLIKARWNDGYRFEHFQRVILVKWAKWGNDPKMSDYFRPETLFAGNHFESYLNEFNGAGPVLSKFYENQKSALELISKMENCHG